MDFINPSVILPQGCGGEGHGRNQLFVEGVFERGHCAARKFVPVKYVWRIPLVDSCEGFAVDITCRMSVESRRMTSLDAAPIRGHHAAI